MVTLTKQKLSKLSEDRLKQLVLKLSEVVVTPPDKLAATLEDKNKMVEFIELNGAYLSLLPDTNLEEYLEDKKTDSKGEDTKVVSKVISSDKEKKEKKQTERVEVKEAKIESPKVKISFLQLPQKQFILRESILGTEYSVYYQPVFVLEESYVFTDNYRVVVEMNDKNHVLYDLYRKNYTFPINNLLKDITEILNNYQIQTNPKLVKVYPNVGVSSVFIEVKEYKNHSLGIILQNSYSSTASKKLLISFQSENKFIPISSSISLDIEPEIEIEKVESFIREFENIINKIDEIANEKLTQSLDTLLKVLPSKRVRDEFGDETIISLLLKVSKINIYDFSFVNKLSKEIEKILLSL
ncbi:MAG: hypothetical protein QW806_09120 [Nitrososphaerota archaeon]